MPTLIPTLKQAFENGHANFGGNICFAQRTYESNMPYVLRFMIDKDLAGCGWITLPKGKFTINENVNRYVSRSQVEVRIDYSDIVANDGNVNPKYDPFFFLATFLLTNTSRPYFYALFQTRYSLTSKLFYLVTSAVIKFVDQNMATTTKPYMLKIA